MASAATPELASETNAHPVFAIAIAYMVLNTIFVVLRFVSRRLQNTRWGWDDLLVALSWLVNMLFFASEIVHILKFKAGHREAYLKTRPDLLAGFSMMSLYIQPIIYSTSLVPPRLAILILYHKIFIIRALRISCWVLGILITSVALIDIFAVAFMCNPREKAWQPSLPGHCLQITNLYIWGTFPNFIFDIFILILPIPSIWRLQTTLRVKLGLLVTFAVGSLGLIIAVIRWSAFFLSGFVKGDTSWDINPLTIYNMTEMSTYLICACLLTLRTLLRRVGETRTIKTLHRWLLTPLKTYHTREEGTNRQTGNMWGARIQREPSLTSSTFLTGFSERSKSAAHADDCETSRSQGNGDSLELGHVPGIRIHVTRDFAVISDMA